MPRLESIYLLAPYLVAPLPSSWGAGPSVLPSLQALSVTMTFTGGLPEAWADGFPQLQQLLLISDRSPGGPRVAVPPSWARGFARLEELHLSSPHLAGSLSSVLPPQPLPNLAVL